jgi:hypothetical protein
LENNIEQIKKELEEIKNDIKDLKREAVKIEHLEEYGQNASFPSLIAVLILQLFTVFLLMWMIYKGGFGF